MTEMMILGVRTVSGGEERREMGASYVVVIFNAESVWDFNRCF